MLTYNNSGEKHVESGGIIVSSVHRNIGILLLDDSRILVKYLLVSTGVTANKTWFIHLLGCPTYMLNQIV